MLVGAVCGTMNAERDQAAAVIRPAAPGDEAGIASVHVSSWRTSYQGIMPDQVLQNLSVERSTAMWQSQLERDSIVTIFVAEWDRTIIGFASGGPFRPDQAPPDFRPGFGCEVYAIYLLGRFKRQGIGGRLIERLGRELAGKGCRSMMLWVLADNEVARRFYEKMGGRVVGKKTDVFGGKELVESAYGFDLSAGNDGAGLLLP